MQSNVILINNSIISLELKENVENKIPQYKTKVDLLLTEKYLKITFECEFATIKAEGTEYNHPLYNGDIVEVLLMTKVYGKYLEIEVNPKNIQYLVEITNDGSNIEIKKLKNTLYSTKVTETNKNLIYDIDIDLKQLEKLNVDISNTTFNLHRQQFIGEKMELSSFSPTLCPSFHKMESFAKIIKK